MESDYIREAYIYCKYQIDTNKSFNQFCEVYFSNCEIIQSDNTKILELGDSALLFKNDYIQIEHPFELMDYHDFYELFKCNELKEYTYFKELFVTLRAMGINEVYFTLNPANIDSTWESIMAQFTENDKYFKISL